MTLLLKALGGISALILLAIALFGQVLTVAGVLLGAIKVAIILIFLVVIAMIVFSILRDRSHRRREAANL